MLPFEVARLATNSPVRVFPGVWKPLFLDSFPGTDLHPYLFCLSLSFIFFPTSFWRQWAAFLPDVLCRHSEDFFLWNLLSAQMFFWWICGRESGLPILLLCHLLNSPCAAFFHGKSFFTRLWGIEFLLVETSETIANFLRDSFYKLGSSKNNRTTFGRIKVQMLLMSREEYK